MMTYGELERTLGHDVVRHVEASFGQALGSAAGSDRPETYEALLELLPALLAASIITRVFGAADRARQLAGRLIALVDTSLSIGKSDMPRS